MAGTLSVALAAAQEPAKRGDEKRSRTKQTQAAPTNQAPPANQAAPSRLPRNQFVPAGTMDRPPMKDDQHHEGKRGRTFGPRAGDWLRQYKDVPVNEQEKALSNDPSFQRLPAERQDKLRDRLRKFNNLSPEMKDRLLDRMEKFETLPPEQRQRLQAIQERMRQLPEDRRQKLRSAFHQLKGMTPEQRAAYFGSERFQSVFSDEERDILRGLTDIEGTPELAEPPDPRSED